MAFPPQSAINYADPVRAGWFKDSLISLYVPGMQTAQNITDGVLPDRFGANDGFISGVTFASNSTYGLTAEFDGFSDVLIPSDPTLVNTPFTVLCWRATTSTAGGDVLIGKWPAGGNESWLLRSAESAGGGDAAWNFGIDGGSNYGIKDATRTNDGNFHAIEGNYSGTAGQIYVDGSLEDSVSVSGSLRTSTQDIYIGRYPPPNGSFYVGSIGLIAILDIVMDSSQRAEIVANPFFWLNTLFNPAWALAARQSVFQGGR